MENRALFDGFGSNLAHVFFILWKQILAWFHIKNQPQGPKLGEGGAKLMQNHTISFTCVFVSVKLNPCQNTSAVPYR